MGKFPNSQKLFVSRKSIQTINDAQILVHATIEKVGGYWKPLSAVARLLEELGEFAEAIKKGQSYKQKVADELADLFVISTCVANQYCANLTEEYIKLRMPTNRLKLHSSILWSLYCFQIEDLFCSAGIIARIVNAYDGEKLPKSGEILPTIQRAVAEFHKFVFIFGANFHLKVLARVESKLRQSLQRDQNRFRVAFDPSMAASLKTYYRIHNLPECDFGSGRKFWGAPTWDERSSLRRNLSNVIDSLDRFIRIAPYEGIGGFIILADEERYSKQAFQIENLTRTVAKALNDFSAAKFQRSEKLSNSPMAWRFYRKQELLRITVCAKTCSMKGKRKFTQPFIMFIIEFDKNKASSMVADKY